MHISKLLRCFVPVETTPPVQTIDNDITVIKEMLLKSVDELRTQTKEAEFTTALNGKQAVYVMEQVFALREKYFRDVPLAESFKKPFVWNIPSYVYTYLQDVVDKEEADVMNPMLLFYIFLTDDPDEYLYGKYLQILSQILQDNKSIIDKYAAEYDAYLSEEGE